MRKFMLVILALCLGGLGALSEGKFLRIAFDAADLKTLDPHLAAATMDRAVVDMIFNGLVRYKPGDISAPFEPDLAESWDVSEDGLTWTFYLRKGVYFHPFEGYPEGYELTAEDVVYSLRKAADPGRSAYAGEYAGMEFVVVDRYTVQVKLPKPMPPSLVLPKFADYAGGFIVSKLAVEAFGDEGFRTHPVGTGPFMFKEYSPLEKVVLVANPNYFRGKPKLDGVVVYYMPNLSAREAALETGQVDVIEGPPEQPWVEKMKEKPGVVVDTFGPGECAVLHFNMSKPPFDDIRVRKAMAYALDREELLHTVGPDIADPLCSPVPPLLPGGLTCEEVGDLRYDVNREKALELLEEAGYPGGFSIEVVISERAEYLIPMQNIQAQLAEIGVEVKLKVVDHSSMHTLIRQDVNPMVLYVAWRPNADVFLTRFYHSHSIVVTGKKPDTNFSHLGGVDADGDGVVDSIDDLIEAARVELDPEAQIGLWKEACRKILELAAAYPLYIKKFVYARSPKVDYGYELKSTLALYPQVNELTSIGD